MPLVQYLQLHLHLLLLFDVDVGCPPIDGYNAAADKDGGGARAQVPFASAAAACTADRLCKGFNRQGSLLSSLSPLVKAAGNCLYSKRLASKSRSKCWLLGSS